MMKKIASLTLGLVLLIAGSAFANNIDFSANADNELGVINVSGTAEADWGNRKVAIMVTRPSASSDIDYDNLTKEAFISNVYTIKEVLCDSEGKFSAQIKFAENEDMGYYIIRVGASGIENNPANDKKVLFATKDDAKRVRMLVNDADDAVDIKEVIDGYQPGDIPNSEILSLNVSDDAMYNAHPITVCNYIFALKGTGYKTLVDLQTAFKKSSALAEIEHAEGSLITLEKIEQYADLIGIDITTSEYVKNKEKTAELVKSNIEKLASYETNPAKFFTAMSAVAAINAANRSTVMKIVEKNKESLDITLGKEYEKLSSYEVGKALVGKNFDCVEDVRTALSERISSLSDKGGSKGSGGGGGGGSSSGKGGIIAGNTTPIKPIEETKPVQKNEFSDVSASHWAYKSIMHLCEKGIVSGMGDGSFSPDSSVSREQIAKMVVNAFDVEKNEGNSFTDVDENAWYNAYVSAAFKSGIVNGMGDGSFGVGKAVSRQDLMVILYRALLNKGYKFTQSSVEDFEDRLYISDYASFAVGALYKEGIVNGTGNNIEPLRVCSRAEAAKLIYETISKLSEKAEEGIHEN